MSGFRVITGLCLLVVLYCVFEWSRLAWLSHDAQTPAGKFLVLHDGKKPTITAYVDYRCGNCQATYKAFDDLRALHPEYTYVVRPVSYIDAQSETVTLLALAAGLEGKFNDIHAAFLEKGGDFPERFLRETVSLYGMDYDDLSAKSQSEEVIKLLADNLDDAIWLGVDSVPSFTIGSTYYRLPGDIEDVTVTDLLPLLAQAR